MSGPATFIEPYGQGHQGGKYEPRRYRVVYPRCVLRGGDHMRQGDTVTAFVDRDYSPPVRPGIGFHEFVEDHFQHPHYVNGVLKPKLPYHQAHLLASKAEKQYSGARLYNRGLRETQAVIAQNRRQMRVRRGL